MWGYVPRCSISVGVLIEDDRGEERRGHVGRFRFKGSGEDRENSKNSGRLTSRSSSFVFSEY